MSVDEQLRREDSFAVLAHADVNVWRAAGIGDRFNRAEVILALRVGQEAAVALEVFVAAVSITAARMQICAVIVDLPNLDEGVADGFALGVQYAAG